MILIALYALLILLYCSLSRRLEQGPLTGPMVFTLGGLALAFLSPALEVQAESHVLLGLAEVGLVMTLFNDSARIDLSQVWRLKGLPLRLLSVGMLLTILAGTLLARAILPELSWLEAAILSAVLAPTDAGLGQSIVSSARVPSRIRQTLNVEAGLNDGLAVPFLMLFIGLASETVSSPPGALLRLMKEQIGYGVGVGAVVGLLAGGLLHRAQARQWSEPRWRASGLATLPVLCIVASEATGASMFIAAFVCGLAARRAYPEAGEPCLELAEAWGSALNLFVFFLFGIFLAPRLGEMGARPWLYALASLTAIRMIPVAVALWGTGLCAATVGFVGWFGPRGLASIVLGMVYLEQNVSLAGEEILRQTVMATVFLSVLAHGASAHPGIELYVRRLSRRSPGCPELEPDEAGESP